MSKKSAFWAVVAVSLLSTPALAATATVEVVELSSKGQTAHRFVVALAEDGRPSQIESASGPVHYKLSVRQTQPKRKTAVVHVDLRRHHRGGDSVSIAVTNRVAQGKWVELGRLPRAKGGTLRVALLLSP